MYSTYIGQCSQMLTLVLRGKRYVQQTRRLLYTHRYIGYYIRIYIHLQETVCRYIGYYVHIDAQVIIYIDIYTLRKTVCIVDTQVIINTQIHRLFYMQIYVPRGENGMYSTCIGYYIRRYIYPKENGMYSRYKDYYIRIYVYCSQI